MSEPLTETELRLALRKTADHLRDHPEQWTRGTLYRKGLNLTTDRRRADSACALGRLGIISQRPVAQVIDRLGPVTVDRITRANDAVGRDAVIRVLRGLARRKKLVRS